MNGPMLKPLLRKKGILVPGVFDCLSAELAVSAGFPALYISGAGLSGSYLGRPDIGLLTLDEVADNVRRIRAIVNAPLIVDADTGFGGPLQTAYAVRVLEKAGASGIQIEDQRFPKRCGHLKGKTLIPAEEMVQKVRAAAAGRMNRQTVIIARTDARGVTGFSDALRRSRLYRKAGAGMIFPEALRKPVEFRDFIKRGGTGYSMANMTEFGVSPLLNAKALAQMGYQIIIYPMTAFRTAAKAMEKAYKALKRKGSNADLVPNMQTRAELYKLNKYAEYERKEKEWRN